jgi:hypothetical protein
MKPPNYDYENVPRATIRSRLSSIAKYLTGITAVVDGMNKGAGDSVAIAVRAIEAASEDLDANVTHPERTRFEASHERGADIPKV